jgi:hypothetical protein
MSLTSALEALQNTPVATGIRDSLLWFPLLEAAHVVALGLVFGTIMIVDLRILGLAGRERSYGRISEDMLKWTWGAFALAVVTGSLMFSTNARVYVDNTFFRVKFALMALAGLNMLVFQLGAGRKGATWAEGGPVPGAARAAALLSLVLWLAVIGMGRAVGFTTTGEAAKETAPPSDIDFDSFLGGGPSDAAPAPPASGG